MVDLGCHTEAALPTCQHTAGQCPDAAPTGRRCALPRWTWCLGSERRPQTAYSAATVSSPLACALPACGQNAQSHLDTKLVAVPGICSCKTLPKTTSISFSRMLTSPHGIVMHPYREQNIKAPCVLHTCTRHQLYRTERAAAAGWLPEGL